MTQPPHGPGHQPWDPRQYPQAAPVEHGFPAMRGVDQHTTRVERPRVVVVAFGLWLLASLAWPLGSIVRIGVEEGTFEGFGPIMSLFVSGCLFFAGLWGAISFFGGSYYARIALCGGSLVVGVLALAAALVAARDGLDEPLSWVVIVARLVLPAVAAVVSFLPGTRHWFAGNLG
ncbi:hypothetical protein GCM10010492_28180 [Saccharothrix mutabilis subsp. mutabilis]|uniref:Uncharacterized protein n=1 Tax=Saccharothrix mutabilis subsp. mutabilis TaxID=66855 RepID=A0ABN0TR71_9PSEU